jgi:peptide-methionine (R)-S-oxide reductase
VVKTEAEWEKSLNREINITSFVKRNGTPFQNEFNDNHKGSLFCAACKLPLFSSETKFNSGTGWPSFYAPLNKIE